MPGRNFLMIGVAAVLGLIAVLIANAYFSGVEQRQVRVAQEQQLARIVVASRPLEFGGKLALENIRLQNWPASSVPVGAFRSIADALKGGRVALRPIVVGEPVLASKVSGTDGRAVLSANLPEGQRAVTIPVNNVSGVAGFVRPGDVVDVLLTRTIPGEGAGGNDQMTNVVLSAVQVLAIDQSANEADTEAKVGGTATVQVDLFSAQKLVLAQKLGALTLVLRNVQTQTGDEFAVVTARDLGGKGLYLAARRQPQSVGSSPMFRVPTMAAMPGSGSGAMAPMRPAGPAMTVVRGTSATEYSVGHQARGW